jgi:argininosuccinate lyase
MKHVWKERFTKPLDRDVAAFLCSTEDDTRLIAYDIKANRAHIRMLKKQKLITHTEFTKLDAALKKLQHRHARNRLSLRRTCEDVHINIEEMVRKHTGHVADSLHMARSRNDLIATDMRLFARDAIIMLLQDITRVQHVLVVHARAHAHVIVPGYTHTQRAQPVTWAFFLLGLISKLQRDHERLQDAYARVNMSPLGACALAGTPHAIDPDFTARQLGFTCFVDNCMDGVSDRDFLFETVCACAQVCMHIASFAEDCIMYTTEEFALVELDDAIATGSSIMPHKKNADVFELLRARSGVLIGHVVAMFSVLKGLPSAYDRDLQETKKIVFESVQTLHECLCILARVVPQLHLVKHEWATQPTLCCATTLVDHLISSTCRFRKAYYAVGACARKSRGDIGAFIRLCAKRFRMDEADIATLLTPEYAVHATHSPGGTGPRQVKKALVRAQRKVAHNEQKVKRLKMASRYKL